MQELICANHLYSFTAAHRVTTGDSELQTKLTCISLLSVSYA